MKYVEEEETLTEVLYVQTEKNDRAKKREAKLLDKKKNGHLKKAPKKAFYDDVDDEDYLSYLRYGRY